MIEDEWDEEARQAILRRKKYNKPWDVTDELPKDDGDHSRDERIL